MRSLSERRVVTRKQLAHGNEDNSLAELIIANASRLNLKTAVMQTPAKPEVACQASCVVRIARRMRRWLFPTNERKPGSAGVIAPSTVALKQASPGLRAEEVAIAAPGTYLRSDGGAAIYAADAFSDEELFDAISLLTRLKRSPLPTDHDYKNTPERRHAIFSRQTGWHVPFPQIEAIWSADPRVVVFYSWGCGQYFMNWAKETRQTSLMPTLKTYYHDPIAVVPLIARADPALMRVLQRQIKLLWDKY